MIHVFEGVTADQAWIEAADVLLNDERLDSQRSRAGSTREVLHALLAIHRPCDRWILSRRPAINPAFAIAEVVWIVRGRDDAAFLNHWNPILPRFAGSVERYYGAYGHRLRVNFGIDQLENAFRALEANPDSRQVVLQIWDPARDLPGADAVPRAVDVPCNLCSILKVRRGRLEWMQILRSNDLFLGVPHNIVQFTTLQEILSGWLDIEVGSYCQLSDSLHLYEEDMKRIRVVNDEAIPSNPDSLRLPKSESDRVWRSLEDRMNLMVTRAGLSPTQWQSTMVIPDVPESFANLFRVVAADDARRRGWAGIASDVMGQCSNPLLKRLWEAWALRRATSAAAGE